MDRLEFIKILYFKIATIRDVNTHTFGSNCVCVS